MFADASGFTPYGQGNRHLTSLDMGGFACAVVKLPATPLCYANDDATETDVSETN